MNFQTEIIVKCRRKHEIGFNCVNGSLPLNMLKLFYPNACGLIYTEYSGFKHSVNKIGENLQLHPSYTTYEVAELEGILKSI